MKKMANRHLVPKAAIPFSLRSLLALSVFIIFIATSLYLELFSIQKVSCHHSTDDQCSEPILAELQHLKGSFFFSANISKTIQKIKKGDPSIQEIRVVKSFPYSADFAITTAQPILAVKCLEMVSTISAEGNVQQSRGDIPLNVPSIQAQEAICQQILSTRSIPIPRLQELKEFMAKIEAEFPDYKVEIVDFSTLVMKTSSEQRILLLVDQLNYQLQMYVYLQEHQSLPDNWNELDLRFQRAIVR